MTRSVPAKLVALVLAIGAAAFLALDAAANLGLGATTAAALVLAFIFGGWMYHAAKVAKRDLLLAEAVCMGLLGACVFAFAFALEARDATAEARSGEARAEAALRKERTKPRKVVYDFIVHDDERDPNSGTSFSDEGAAFERVEPNGSSASPDDGRHELGEHLEVTCWTSDADGYGIKWYKLENGNFMDETVVKQAPYSGEPRPPECK